MGGTLNTCYGRTITQIINKPSSDLQRLRALSAGEHVTAALKMPRERERERQRETETEASAAAYRNSLRPHPSTHDLEQRCEIHLGSTV